MKAAILIYKPNSQAFQLYNPHTLHLHNFTHNHFLVKLLDIITGAGLSGKNFAAHSFRHGGVSFAFQAGIPIELITIMGDWKSNAVLLYLTVPIEIRLHSVNALAKHFIKYRGLTSIQNTTSTVNNAPSTNHNTLALGYYYLYLSVSSVCRSKL